MTDIGVINLQFHIVDNFLVKKLTEFSLIFSF